MAEDIIIDAIRLEDCVKEGFFHLKRSFVDDIIEKSDRKEVIRYSMAEFFGAYRAVKASLKEKGVVSIVGYLEGEALLDYYSAHVAAKEALAYILSQGIARGHDARALFNGSMNFYKDEKDPSLRERQIRGDLLRSYENVSRNLNPKMIPDITISYFEWIIEKSYTMSRELRKSAQFDEEIKKYDIIFLKGKAPYNCFRPMDKSAEQKVKAEQTKQGMEDKIAEDEYPYLDREPPNVTFEDIGGLERHKKLVDRVIRLPLEKKERMEYLGGGSLNPPKGLIFYGPSGTGKTYIAKAIANEMHLPFFNVVGSEFMQKYVGDGAKMVRKIFNAARSLAPAIVFIDEVDACLMDRGSDGGKYSTDVVNQMLAEIDGFKPLDSVKVIVATNYYEKLDGTFCSRIPRKYHLRFEVPDAAARHNALIAMTKNGRLNGVDLLSLANLTDGASFRGLKFIYNEAGIYATDEDADCIVQGHFDIALAEYLENPEAGESKK